MNDTCCRLLLATTPRVQRADGACIALADTDALLLAWLAIEGPSAREQLAQLFWPGSSSDAARNALRQRLFRLRRQIGCELAAGLPLLALADGVQHDLDGAPTLLGNLQPEGCEALAAWLQARRHQRREAERARLLHQIRQFEAEGRGAEGLPLAEALLALDLLREDAHRCLMRLHYLAGDRAAALRAFDRCEQVLKHELGTRPAPETLALLATLEAAAPPAAPAPAAQTPALPAALLRPPRLVGRDAELALLHAALRGGGRVLVCGEAGLGKTHLLQTLADQLPTALYCRARSGDAAVPYATLGRLLRTLGAAAPPALAAAPAGHLAPLLPELAPAGAARPAAPVQQEQLLAALRGVLRAAAVPALLLDDLHQADPATLQLLPELLDAGRAWVLAQRPAAAESVQARPLAELARTLPLQPLTLGALDDAALAELVDSLALPGASGATLAPALHARSGGNPLFALETLKRAWCDGSGLASGRLPRPVGIGQLIETTLARLSTAALQLARVAAIAGTDFSVALAERVLGQSALALADAWAELEARQVLRGSAFAHDLVHEAVAAGVPAVLARHVHGQVAQWLEQHGAEPAGIAAHWQAAAEPLRALPWLQAAAVRAHAALREPERVAFLLEGAAIAEAAGQRAQAFALLAQAVEAHMDTMRDADGWPLLDRMDRLADTPAQRARAAGDRAWYCSTQGDWSTAIACGQRALDLSTQARDPAEGAGLRASIAQRLGTALAMAGRFDEALPQLRAAEPWVAQHAGSDGAAEFHGNLAAVLDNLGRAAEAEPHHRRVIQATWDLGDLSFHATARANLAVSRLNAGDVAGAQAQLEQAQQLVDRHQLAGASSGFIAALQAQAARARGDYGHALAACDHAEALLRRARSGWLAVVQMHRAQLWLDLGQHTRAQQALTGIDGITDAPARLRARHALLQARLLRALGRPARAGFDTALALAPQPGWPELRLTIRIERCAVLAAAEAAAELHAVAAEARAPGLAGVVLAAQLRLAALAGVAAPGSAVALAAQAAARRAEQLMATQPALEPNQLYRAERWLGPALAARAAGRSAHAAALAAAALEWVGQAAATLPAPLADAFVHRHAMNAQLRQLQHGRAAACFEQLSSA